MVAEGEEEEKNQAACLLVVYSIISAFGKKGKEIDACKILRHPLNFRAGEGGGRGEKKIA